MDVNNDSKQNHSMSCKVEHQTRKHKDAWEINCSYNIYIYIYIYIYATKFLWLFHWCRRIKRSDFNYSNSNNNPAGRLVQQYIQSASSLVQWNLLFAVANWWSLKEINWVSESLPIHMEVVGRSLEGWKSQL